MMIGVGRKMLVLKAVLLAGLINAQCDVAITSFQVQMVCYDYSPMVQAGFSGGTPPYSLRFTTNGGSITEVQTPNTYWSGPLTSGLSPDYNATLLVTDALGCTANASAQWTAHFPITAVITASQTCDGNLQFDWNGAFEYASVGIPVWPTCNAPFYYGVGLGNNTNLTGEVSSDWTQVSPGHWRFQVPLALGPTYVMIGGPSSSCEVTLQVQCYEPLYIDNMNVAPASGCLAQFGVRTALSGALPSGTVMTDQLRASGLLPTTEPYTALGYTYVGTSAGQSISPSLLAVTGSDAIVDWVVVELRSPSNPANVLYSRPALLQRDGDVVGVNGTSYINTPLAPGNYYVAIRHRNHLGIMTASARPLSLDPSTAMIDFRSSSLATYGTAARVQVGSVQCMVAGDANRDGTIAYTGSGNDRDVVLVAIGGVVPTNTLTNVYDRRDVNLDGNVMYTGTANDRDVILQSIGGTVPTATRTQQLP